MSEVPVGVLLIAGGRAAGGQANVWAEAVTLREQGLDVRVVAVDAGVDDVLASPRTVLTAHEAGVQVGVEHGCAQRRRAVRLPAGVDIIDMDELAEHVLTPGWMTVWR